MTATELVQKAKEARELAYAPYSHFTVGAALLTSDGRVFLGANIENSAYSVTCCAERVALFRAVSEGARDFCAVAVIGGEAGKEATDVCPPCGICRQAMIEHFRPDTEIVLGVGDECVVYTISELLPNAFSGGNLK